jgi:hypothetical protein
LITPVHGTVVVVGTVVCGTVELGFVVEVITTVVVVVVGLQPPFLHGGSPVGGTVGGIFPTHWYIHTRRSTTTEVVPSALMCVQRITQPATLS